MEFRADGTFFNFDRKWTFTKSWEDYFLHVSLIKRRTSLPSRDEKSSETVSFPFILLLSHVPTPQPKGINPISNAQLVPVGTGRGGGEGGEGKGSLESEGDERERSLLFKNSR